MRGTLVDAAFIEMFKGRFDFNVNLTTLHSVIMNFIWALFNWCTVGIWPFRWYNKSVAELNFNERENNKWTNILFKRLIKKIMIEIWACCSKWLAHMRDNFKPDSDLSNRSSSTWKRYSFVLKNLHLCLSRYFSLSLFLKYRSLELEMATKL